MTMRPTFTPLDRLPSRVRHSFLAVVAVAAVAVPVALTLPSSPPGGRPAVPAPSATTADPAGQADVLDGTVIAHRPVPLTRQALVDTFAILGLDAAPADPADHPDGHTAVAADGRIVGLAVNDGLWTLTVTRPSQPAVDTGQPVAPNPVTAIMQAVGIDTDTAELTIVDRSGLRTISHRPGGAAATIQVAVDIATGLLDTATVTYSQTAAVPAGPVIAVDDLHGQIAHAALHGLPLADPAGPTATADLTIDTATATQVPHSSPLTTSSGWAVSGTVNGRPFVVRIAAIRTVPEVDTSLLPAI